MNGEVDVLIVGVSGVGSVAVQGRCYGLRAGVVVLVPKGAMRSTRSDSADFAYLTVHRHRGPLQVDQSRNPDL
ncbi:MAG: hypothetical protein M3P37_06085 [Actinomycetota bacterium]|nr:hypothetical protein [Actinomycetota bacterium]